MVFYAMYAMYMISMAYLCSLASFKSAKLRCSYINFRLKSSLFTVEFLNH